MRKLCLVAYCLIIFSVSCNNTADTKGPQFKKDETLSQIKPQKPVRIQLKRNYKGNYSWEIKGDDVKKIIKADENLRSYIKKQ